MYVKQLKKLIYPVILVIRLKVVIRTEFSKDVLEESNLCNSQSSYMAVCILKINRKVKIYKHNNQLQSYFSLKSVATFDI